MNSEITDEIEPGTEEVDSADAQEQLDGELESLEGDDEQVDDAGDTTVNSITLLEAAQAESRVNYEKYLRSVAEFENFKKRSVKERADMLRYAGQHLASDLLNIVDDLTRATTQETTGSAEEILKGVSLIRDSFTAVLNKHSIKSVDSKGEKFDPSQHEALSIVPSLDHEAGIVIEELNKAYFFKDKLLRPAKVVVSAEAPSSPEE